MILYEEVDHLFKNPITYLSWPLVIFAWVVTTAYFLFGIKIGSKPPPELSLYIFFAMFGVLLPLLLVTGKLDVKVGRQYVKVDFFPFGKMTISLEDIDRVEVCESVPVSEFGGWGVREHDYKGTSFSVRGNKGVQIYLKSGKKIFLGSQDSTALANSISKLLKL